MGRVVITAEDLRMVAVENMPRPMPRSMYQPLLDAADRIEALEKALRSIADNEVSYWSIEKFAREALEGSDG
jgi:nicotinic acid mononucleotide adenylyltransferase